jgi:uncharacterized protein (DUF1330 family)
LVELAAEHAYQARLPEELAGLARRSGATVLAFDPPGRIAGLEPGTVAAGMLIAKWRDSESAQRVAHDVLLPRIKVRVPAATVPLVLAVEGLPEAGLPDAPEIPTTASVPRPQSTHGNVILVIRGTAWDQNRLDRYRDIILPMHKERGAYYEVFAIAPGQVQALSGEWRDQIFAISRWPTRDAAEDFWYSDRYQTQAIAQRLGAGRFTVHMLRSAAP